MIYAYHAAAEEAKDFGLIDSILERRPPSLTDMKGAKDVKSIKSDSNFKE